jgi:hypothetical protein
MAVRAFIASYPPFFNSELPCAGRFRLVAEVLRPDL